MRVAYGALELTPAALYQMTPGELADLATARSWANRERAKANGRQAPMSMVERSVEVKKFDAMMDRAMHAARAEKR